MQLTQLRGRHRHTRGPWIGRSGEGANSTAGILTPFKIRKTTDLTTGGVPLGRFFRLKPGFPGLGSGPDRGFSHWPVASRAAGSGTGGVDVGQRPLPCRAGGLSLMVVPSLRAGRSLQPCKVYAACRQLCVKCLLGGFCGRVMVTADDRVPPNSVTEWMCNDSAAPRAAVEDPGSQHEPPPKLPLELRGGMPVASLMLVVTATAQSPSQAGYRSYPVGPTQPLRTCAMRPDSAAKTGRGRPTSALIPTTIACWSRGRPRHSRRSCDSCSKRINLHRLRCPTRRSALFAATAWTRSN